MKQVNLATFNRKLKEDEFMIVSLPDDMSPEMRFRAEYLLHQAFVPVNMDDFRESMKELGTKELKE